MRLCWRRRCSGLEVEVGAIYHEYSGTHEMNDDKWDFSAFHWLRRRRCGRCLLFQRVSLQRGMSARMNMNYWFLLHQYAKRTTEKKTYQLILSICYSVRCRALELLVWIERWNSASKFQCPTTMSDESDVIEVRYCRNWRVPIVAGFITHR